VGEVFRGVQRQRLEPLEGRLMLGMLLCGRASGATAARFQRRMDVLVLLMKMMRPSAITRLSAASAAATSASSLASMRPIATSVSHSSARSAL
jgi:hypothetical protein